MGYTHIVIDSSFNNFDVGTAVYLVSSPVSGICMISDGHVVKMCYEFQLRKLDYSRYQILIY